MSKFLCVFLYLDTEWGETNVFFRICRESMDNFVYLSLSIKPQLSLRFSSHRIKGITTLVF